MFRNDLVSEFQDFKGYKNILFEPDSSPHTWEEHFKKAYSGNEFLQENYDFRNLCFYNCFKDFGLKSGKYEAWTRYNYLNKPLVNSSKGNRLFVLEKGCSKKIFNSVEYIAATCRLGGDCDFNFNDDKYSFFVKLINGDDVASENEKYSAQNQLHECHNMHHRLLNFSLMQSMGKLQTFKGKKLDRLDTFVFELDKYYRGVSNDILEEAENNSQALQFFLNDISDVYNYCKIFYFIEDKNFVDELIAQGNMPITNVKELSRYMSLAKKFWSNKESHFLRNEFLTIGDYFQNGGESYSRRELIRKIENDLGYGKEESNELINKCEERGFITFVGNVFTR